MAEKAFYFTGADERSRTADLLITNNLETRINNLELLTASSGCLHFACKSCFFYFFLAEK